MQKYKTSLTCLSSVEKGSSILPPFETSVGRVGMTICFDLRFPEISLALHRQKADIITYPSAFTVPTGHAHWKTLQRARAIETQAYVIAAAQSGHHNEKRVSYVCPSEVDCIPNIVNLKLIIGKGNSLIISPWGDVLAELGIGDEAKGQIATAEIDLGEVQRIKKTMPLLRRTDVYPEV